MIPKPQLFRRFAGIATWLIDRLAYDEEWLITEPDGTQTRYRKRNR